jgi:hypothetical protein
MEDHCRQGQGGLQKEARRIADRGDSYPTKSSCDSSCRYRPLPPSEVIDKLLTLPTALGDVHMHGHLENIVSLSLQTEGRGIEGAS